MAVVYSSVKYDKKNLVYNPNEHECGLFPQPIHIGKYLREKRIDFQLPYDIWWLRDTGLVSIIRFALSVVSSLEKFVDICCHSGYWVPFMVRLYGRFLHVHIVCVVFQLQLQKPMSPKYRKIRSSKFSVVDSMLKYVLWWLSGDSLP